MGKVNIAEKFAKISEYWKPYIAAELNPGGKRPVPHGVS